MSDGRTYPAIWTNDEDIKQLPYEAAKDWLEHAELYPCRAHGVPVKILKAILAAKEGVQMTENKSKDIDYSIFDTPDDIDDRIRRVVCEGLAIDPLTADDDNTDLDQFGADSLDYIEIAMALEAEFAIIISDADLEDVKTVAQLKVVIKGSQVDGQFYSS